MLTGYQADDVRQLLTGKTITFGQLFDQYQSTAARRGIADALKVVEISLVPHTPLYYIAIYYWSRLFDAHKATLRALAAIFGMLQLPAVLWLSWELFGTAQAAVFATALFFISPLQLWYCQENSEYSLIAALAAAGTASLLRATRRDSLIDWLVYALIMTVGLYTSLNLIALLVAHFGFVFLHSRPVAKSGLLTLPRSFLLFLTSALIAFVAISPFLFILIMNISILSDTMAWTGVAISADKMAVGWLDDLIAPICWTGDFQFSVGVKVALAMLPIFSVYYLCRKADARTRNILLLTTIVPFLSYAVPDLLLGGQRSTITRYLMVSAVSVELIIAFCLIEFFKQKKMHLVVNACLATLIGFEAFCCYSVITVHSHVIFDHTQQLMARTLNQDPGSLIISEEVATRMNIFQFLCLSHIVEPSTRLLWLDHPDEIVLPKGLSHFYVYNPPPTLMYAIESYGYKLRPVKGDWSFLRAEPEQHQ